MSSSLLIALCVIATLCVVNAANSEINTGAAYYALRFPDAGQASVTLPESLSAELPLTFSFEAWVMLPGTVGSTQVTTADGLYKSVVSRYTVQPDGTYHNMWADFNLQVQMNGDINFFMGSGVAPSFYGVIITAGQLPAGVWTHLAFSVHTPSGQTNPDTVSLFVNGVELSSAWKVGNRQLHEDVPIHLGAYLNQDGDVKWWRGYMDEVRFWAADLSAADVLGNMGITIDPTDPELLAYYKCDSGALLVDATPHNYDGQFVTAAGTIQYQMSGVKLGFDVDAGRQASVPISLIGVSTVPFTYVIETIPNTTVGLLKVGAITLFSDNLPYALTGNTVTFVAGNSEGTTGTFTYYGTNGDGREATSTTVYLSVDRSACNPDACGVCGGNNSTCSCLPVPYKGYSESEIQTMLMTYELETTLQALEEIEMHLEQASDALADEVNGTVSSQLTEVQTFREVCLSEVYDNLKAFLADLSSK